MLVGIMAKQPTPRAFPPFKSSLSPIPIESLPSRGHTSDVSELRSIMAALVGLPSAFLPEQAAASAKPPVGCDRQFGDRPVCVFL